VSSTNPPPDGTRGSDPGPGDLKRWGKWAVLALVALVVVLTLSVSLSRCGPDDGPSGGEPEGMGPAVTEVTTTG
jgi:hypothetical protein